MTRVCRGCARLLLLAAGAAEIVGPAMRGRGWQPTSSSSRTSRRSVGTGPSRRPGRPGAARNSAPGAAGPQQGVTMPYHPTTATARGGYRPPGGSRSRLDPSPRARSPYSESRTKRARYGPAYEAPAGVVVGVASLRVAPSGVRSRKRASHHPSLLLTNRPIWN
jgi:hypothetical protein